MKKTYIFRYNGNMKNNEEFERKWLFPDELTNHQILANHDGQKCSRYTDDEEWELTTGEPLTTAYFEDGCEMTVYLSELTEIG